MNKKSFIILSAILVVVLLIVLFLFASFKNSKNCDQLVIDTYEILSGIDIPKQTDAQCYYDEKERIRTGVYTIKNTSGFIEKYELKALIVDDADIFWSQQFLMDTEAILPDSINSLFRKQGDSKGNKWQCLVDRDSGQMWFEVKWKN